MVLPASLGVARAPRYSGRYPGRPRRFAYGGVTLFAPPFQVALLRLCFLTSRRSYVAPNLVLQPHVSNARTLCADMVWARPRSLATTRGVSVLISFPAGTEMFQFPALAPDLPVTLCYQGRVAPFGNLRVSACLPARRSLSQAPTPFIAS